MTELKNPYALDPNALPPSTLIKVDVEVARALREFVKKKNDGKTWRRMQPAATQAIREYLDRAQKELESQPEGKVNQ